MKVLCLSKSGENYIFSPESKDHPKIGVYYNLDDAIHGTAAQNRTFHLLIQIFYTWMLKQDLFVIESSSSIVYDFRCADWQELKDIFKFRYGAGYDRIQYVNDKFAMVRVKTWEEVPGYALDDYNAGNRNRIKAVLKSWGDYTKTERRKLLDNTINIMKHCGVDSKRFHEILDSMEN